MRTDKSCGMVGAIMIEMPRTYPVSPHESQPLLDFIIAALRDARCALLHAPKADTAPFHFSIEMPTGERIGLIAYAFRAHPRASSGRRSKVHHFQVSYGAKTGDDHELWLDPLGLHVTLLLGIDPELGLFVGADPVFHSPIEFPTSIAFTQTQVARILKQGFHAWQREPLRGNDENAPIEVLVGGVAGSFLQYVLFEREAFREDQGHRHLLADRVPRTSASPTPRRASPSVEAPPAFRARAPR